MDSSRLKAQLSEAREAHVEAVQRALDAVKERVGDNCYNAISVAGVAQVIMFVVVAGCSLAGAAAFLKTRSLDGKIAALVCAIFLSNVLFILITVLMIRSYDVGFI